MLLQEVLCQCIVAFMYIINTKTKKIECVVRNKNQKNSMYNQNQKNSMYNQNQKNSMYNQNQKNSMYNQNQKNSMCSQKQKPKKNFFLKLN